MIKIIDLGLGSNSNNASLKSFQLQVPHQHMQLNYQQ